MKNMQTNKQSYKTENEKSQTIQEANTRMKTGNRRMESYCHIGQ